jgi:type I restriction-modification system DNA methylase subunit
MVSKKSKAPSLMRGRPGPNRPPRGKQSNDGAGDVLRAAGDCRRVAGPGISRTIYDPTCGTGGMLSVSEEYIRQHNPQAHLTLYGQDYNPEAYAICCSDMLIKDEPVDNIIFGDTLGDGKTSDGYRKVMLPLVVLRRLDCVLEATKDEVNSVSSN